MKLDICIELALLILLSTLVVYISKEFIPEKDQFLYGFISAVALCNFYTSRVIKFTRKYF